ncbi:MAG: class I SAM-dependent methyltransferase [bacterium]
MMLMLLILVALLLGAVAMLLVQLLRERAMRKQRNLVGKWPIQPVLPEVVDPVFRNGAMGPTLDTEVSFVGRGPYVVEGGTSDSEAWILAVVAKNAHRLFEFGTCTGKTAYLWARNAPVDARITTITLAPNDVGDYKSDAHDDPRDAEYAVRESTYSSFMYSGTDVEEKVEQLFGDSKTLDIAPWKDQCDVVFVDGSHAYSYVLSDSAKALQLVRPGGLVLWHDYAGPRHSLGVYEALNELSARIPIVRIQGTTLAAYRRPA